MIRTNQYSYQLFQVKRIALVVVVSFDSQINLSTTTIKADNGKTRFEESGMEMGSTSSYRFSIAESDPLSAKAEYDWQTKTHTYTKLTSDAEYFYLQATSEAWEGDEQIFRTEWDRKFKRDHF